MIFLGMAFRLTGIWLSCTGSCGLAMMKLELAQWDTGGYMLLRCCSLGFLGSMRCSDLLAGCVRGKNGILTCADYPLKTTWDSGDRDGVTKEYILWICVVGSREFLHNTHYIYGVRIKIYMKSYNHGPCLDIAFSSPSSCEHMRDTASRRCQMTF